MRIELSGRRVTLKDRPAPFWALGLFLLAGGLLAVAMALGLATNAGEVEPWERAASIVVGIGVSAGALWWLGRSPATRVEIDPTRRQVRIVRIGLSGRRVRQLQFGDIGSAEVEQGTDAEGGRIWRPAVRLRSGELVLLSELWSHDHAGTEAAAMVISSFMRDP